MGAGSFVSGVGAQQCLLGVTQQRLPVASVAVGYLSAIGAGFSAEQAAVVHANTHCRGLCCDNCRNSVVGAV